MPIEARNGGWVCSRFALVPRQGAQWHPLGLRSARRGMQATVDPLASPATTHGAIVHATHRNGPVFAQTARRLSPWRATESRREPNVSTPEAAQ